MTMDQRQARLEGIFHAALELDPQQREVYLAESCRGAPDLRRDVEILLQAAAASEKIFQTVSRRPSNGHPTVAEVSWVEGPGAVIGRYKILQQIGEGGFGLVFMAEQTEPVSRKVALKVIKLGMDTKQVVARFEAERQALALMDHPNIAKVLDAGATDSGRPYFVMELVKGIPITKFCDLNKLKPNERLGLFIQVCSAIQHAHQKGILHRDIKPSNILVTLHDGEPVPKVIDFGIAKATNQKLTEKTLYTSYAQMIGTPAYMSPEQAEMSGLDVDTRTDVYSLGVLLYELLTGTTPFPEKDLLQKGYAEMQRVIREVEPPRPSTRMSTLQGPQRITVARDRSSRPESLGRELSGDLDWIAMKALEKDRRRRYETVNGLIQDIRRHLNHEPVSAGPPSVIYRTRKFVQRHRVGVLAGAALVLALVAGTLVSTWQAIRATRAEGLARNQQEQAETARERADRLRLRADEQAAEALRQKAASDAVNRWVTEDLLMLVDAWREDRQEPVRADITLKEAILRAAAQLERRFQDQPELEGNLRLVIGKALNSLEDTHHAIEQLRAAFERLQTSLGGSHTNTLAAQGALGWTLAFQYWGVPGTANRELAQEGRTLLEQNVVATREALGPEHPVTLRATLMLGLHYRNAGDLKLSEDIIPQTVLLVTKRAATHGDVPESLRMDAKNFLLWLRQRQGRHAEAKQLGAALWAEKQANTPVEGGKRQYDTRAANILWDHSYYTWWWDRDFQKAEQLLELALDISQERVGDAYPTGRLMYELSRLKLAQGRFDEVIELGRRGVALVEAVCGPAHHWTRYNGRVLAGDIARLGQWGAVAAEFQRQRNRGIYDDQSLAYELLARQLDHETSQLPVLRQMLAELYARNPPEKTRAKTARVLLTLPCSPEDLKLVMHLAARALAKERGELDRALLEGLVAYRQGQFDQVVPKLLPIRDLGRDNPRAALLADYLAVLAAHGPAEDRANGSVLEAPNRRLERLLRVGELETEYPYSEDWTAFACCLVLRETAEERLLGRSHSASVTSESLAAARETWQPIGDLLTRADWAARQRDYAEARRLYLEVWADPHFSLEAAQQQYPWLDLRMAAVFLHCGDAADYQRLCLEDPQVARIRTTISPMAVLLPVDLVSAQVQARALVMARRLVRSLEASLEPGGTPPHLWHRALLGFAAYRNGLPAEALQELELAMKSEDHDCKTLATALAALSAHALGQTGQARQYLARAEEGWRLIVEPAHGWFAPVWHNPCIIELLLKEARASIGAPEPAAAAWNLSRESQR